MEISLSENPFEYFPYEPYECQKEFIRSMINTLVNKKAAIYESPTGTGKSLSLLCGIMKFLQLESSPLSGSLKSKGEGDALSSDLDWLEDFGKTFAKKKFSELKQTQGLQTKIKKFKAREPSKDDDSKMIIDIDSVKPKSFNEEKKLQVYYCTRTHSQIGQVMNEIKKIEQSYKDRLSKSVGLSYTFLGSRKHLCLNKKVNIPQSSITKINNRCADVIEIKKCAYYNQDLIDSLANESSHKVLDIESLTKLGNDITACPYFATRQSVESADIVVIPYNSIINSKIRRSLGITLENKVIIFDEAHNLVENILQTNKCELSIDQCFSLLIGCILYYDKYSTKLKSSSNMLIRQLIKILELIILFFVNKKENFVDNVLSINGFAVELSLTNYNLYKLIDFIELCEIDNKIRWRYEQVMKDFFLKKISYDDDSCNLKVLLEKHSPKLAGALHVESATFEKVAKLFLESDSSTNFLNLLIGLTYMNSDGHIILEKSQNNSLIKCPIYNSIRFIMVNPCREFDSLIKSSRCVILAGGTMKPYDEFNNLLRVVSKDQIEFFEADHIIDKENIYIASILGNPNKNFDKLIYNYGNFKKDQDMLLESILTIIKLHCDVVTSNNITPPNGIVAFLTSYDLMDRLISSPSYHTFLDSAQLEIFYEKKNSTEDVFASYSTSIGNKKNSLLFAVIGGKLSEGINFSDDLARCVLIFGLPFPNIKSYDIKLKMEYYDQLFQDGVSLIKGDDYYENLCMKAVNQSIGRSIRHIKDYASIILVDHRYLDGRIKGKLPKWVLKSGITEVNDGTSLNFHLGRFREFLDFNKQKSSHNKSY